MADAVVFADIDGVANHTGWYASRPKPCADPADWLDPACVARINTICERAGAVIVISSSWRNILGGWQEVRDTLIRRGLTAQVIDGTITDEERIRIGWTDGVRWDEIKRWLNEHPDVQRWVVLEDALVDDVPTDKLVHTDMTVGLTDADVERAVKIFDSAEIT